MMRAIFIREAKETMEAGLIRRLIVVVIVMGVVGIINGQQISTACTSSMISTFTPCLNFITGSSGGSVVTPTAGCCESLKSLTSSGMGCACLILTANVPLPTGFINRTLSLALPRACKMGAGVPLQCQAAGTPLPAPGPVPFLSTAISPGASKAAATTPELDAPVMGPTSNSPPGIRPVVQQPSSLASHDQYSSPYRLLLLFFLFFLTHL